MKDAPQSAQGIVGPLTNSSRGQAASLSPLGVPLARRSLAEEPTPGRGCRRAPPACGSRRTCRHRAAPRTPGSDRLPSTGTRGNDRRAQVGTAAPSGPLRAGQRVRPVRPLSADPRRTPSLYREVSGVRRVRDEERSLSAVRPASAIGPLSARVRAEAPPPGHPTQAPTARGAGAVLLAVTHRAVRAEPLRAAPKVPTRLGAPMPARERVGCVATRQHGYVLLSLGET